MNPCLLCARNSCNRVISLIQAVFAPTFVTKRSWGNFPPALLIEPEVYNVVVLHDIGLEFEALFPGALGLGLLRFLLVGRFDRVEEELRVRPQFDSVHYGTPTYLRLAASCADEIRTGADDESEMGVYHDLLEPQRLANLSARLEEYTPAALQVGAILGS